METLDLKVHISEAVPPDTMFLISEVEDEHGNPKLSVAMVTNLDTLDILKELDAE